ARLITEFGLDMSGLRNDPTPALTYKVDDMNSLAKRGGTHHHNAIGIHHKRVTIEYQLVLPANHVDICYWQADVNGASTRNGFALPLLVDLVRRCVDHDQQFGPVGARELCSFRLPDVLAYQQAATKPLYVNHRGLGTCMKVALFVEDLVVGQLGLP